MDQDNFMKSVQFHSIQWGINPILLLSGIEGLYTFKDVQLDAINNALLDSLILTIFSLRIGDQFHKIAEKNSESSQASVREAARNELRELDSQEIQNSSNAYLQSFAQILEGKQPIYNYHIKALEVAAQEIQQMHEKFSDNSIGMIVLELCKRDQTGYLSSVFST